MVISLMIHTHRVDANAINLDARHYSAPPSCGAFCCLEYRKFFKTVTGARHRVCITPSRTRHSVERAREICIPVQVAQCTSCQALAAQIEFGTGFLAPETDAPNSALEAMSLGRDRKIPAIIREKWRQKRPFCVWARRREFPKTGWWRTQFGKTPDRVAPCRKLLCARWRLSGICLLLGLGCLCRSRTRDFQTIMLRCVDVRRHGHVYW